VKGNISSTSNSKSSRKTSSFSNTILVTLIIFLAIVVLFLSYSLYMKVQNISNDKNKNDREVASAIIQIEVMNGCGVDGVAAKFTDYLRGKSFDVVQVGNYISSNIDETLIIDRIGNRANTEKLADVLGVDKKNIIQQLNKDYFLDATLVIGKDYNKLEPLN
jgi:hypothetical protein